ncbi:HipA family kinase [Nocardioides speluncae]|uniref:HipA family kinase n=1 Tax=Nocardioides speluncae TaxID=2670337 RepID=UPI000D68607E|nr:HipA family kinase [Nocardioides speluncae]
MIPEVAVTRYVTPLREGGSLPGIVEADDLGTYVCKFRGAGQGLRVLVAEVVVGELARRLDIPTPELVALQLDPEIARFEADEEVQDLLKASVGLNLGVDFLPGSFGYDASAEPDRELAGRILWLDACTANVDRSWRNPNLLLWRHQLYAIDHGAALYFHHLWPNGGGSPGRFATQPYEASEHILRHYAAEAAAQDAVLAGAVGPDLLHEVLALVPDEWLEPVPGAESAGAVRARYIEFLAARVQGERGWLPQVEVAE